MADELLPTAPTTNPLADTAEAPYDPFAWTPDRQKRWKAEIDKALAIQEDYHPWWNEALKNYAPSVKENPNEYQLETRTNRAFSIVERKKADLFFQRPELQVSPSPLLETVPNNAAMTFAHATIINQKLGRHGVNLKTLARECIFAYELFGAGWSKLFYRAYTKDIQQPMNDALGQPMSDELGRPIMQTVPVVIKGECGWKPFSNKQALIPADCRTTNFDDDAPWLGMRFTMMLSEARSMSIWKDKIPADFKGSTSATGKPQFFNSGAQGENPTVSEDIVTGTELHYRSCLYRQDIVHPDHLTKLVFIDGIEEPVEERDSPDQTLDAQGRLTPDSLIGYPYHPLIVRTLTDSAFVMSDVAIALPSTEELDAYRKIGQRQRVINLLKAYYDPTKLTTDAASKIERGEQGSLIAVTTEAFDQPNGPLRFFDTKPIPPDNYRQEEDIDRDLAQTFAVDAISAGTTANGSQTATESNLRQANVNVRQGSEQGFVVDWVLGGADKYSTLVQRYLSVEDAAVIVGQQKAVAWDSWRHSIPTRLAFSMTPDSSLKNDTALDRLQLQQLFTYVANDPHVNRIYFLTKLFQKFNLDPAQALLRDEQMPKPKPEWPKWVKGDDLSPYSPQWPVVIDALIKAGIPIDSKMLMLALQVGQRVAEMTAVQEAQDAEMKAAQNGAGASQGQLPHGGKLAPIEGLDKHLADLTGAVSNTGEPSPGMSQNIFGAH